MKVSEIMSSNVACCSPTSSIREVARTMRENDCGAIPVVENGHVAGIITDRDIVVRGIAEGKNVMDLDARSCMTPNVKSVKRDSDLHEVTKMMEREQIRRVVVTDDSDNVVGIVAQADVALNAPRKETGDTVRKVSE